jgi:hypothetical protein
MTFKITKLFIKNIKDAWPNGKALASRQTARHATYRLSGRRLSTPYKQTNLNVDRPIDGIFEPYNYP